MRSSVASNECGANSSESDQVEKTLGGAAECRTPIRQPDRPFDQTRVLHHCRNQLFAGEVRICQTEFLILFFPAPNQIAGLHAEGLKHSVQLRRGRRILQVLDDLELDSVLAEQADRLP